MFGAATIGAFVQLRKIHRKGLSDKKVFDFIDNIVYVDLDSSYWVC